MPTKAEHAAARDAARPRYDELLALQGGTCVCGKPPGKRRHCIDHDHRTLEVRGVLCFICNYVTGARWGMTPELLRKLADYLEDPPARRLVPPIGQEPPPKAKGKVAAS
jgi:hypothetical protein